MNTMYLKSIFEDGIVYFKINSIMATSEFIYEGLEVLYEEEGLWEIDEYELTQEDLDEMYEDGFFNIEAEEFEQALGEAKKHVD